MPASESLDARGSGLSPFIAAHRCSTFASGRGAAASSRLRPVSVRAASAASAASTVLWGDKPERRQKWQEQCCDWLWWVVMRGGVGGGVGGEEGGQIADREAARTQGHVLGGTWGSEVKSKPQRLNWCVDPFL